MNDSLRLLNENCSRIGQDDRNAKPLTPILAAVDFILGCCIIIGASYTLLRERKYAITRRDKWQMYTTAVGKIIGGAVLLPVTAILLLNDEYYFLSRRTCYGLLGLQLFGFIGHYLGVHLNIAVFRLTIFKPLESESILSSRRALSCLCLMWTIALLLVTIPSIVFISQEDIERRNAITCDCSWKVMYPKSYLYFSVYTVLVLHVILTTGTVVRIFHLVKRHRKQIDTQTRAVHGDETGSRAAARLFASCKTVTKHAPVGILVLLFSVLLVLNVHCHRCMPWPLENFLPWFTLGLYLLNITVIEALKKRDH